jgi:hypothetical protein
LDLYRDDSSDAEATEALENLISKHALRGELTLFDAAQILSISYRHCKRVFSRYTDKGAEGLIHRLRGKPSHTAFDSATKQAILALYKERYSDFGEGVRRRETGRGWFSDQPRNAPAWLKAAGLAASQSQTLAT